MGDKNKPTEEIPEDLVTEKNGVLYIASGNLADATDYSVPIDSEPYKHDITQHTAVVLFRGEFYKFSYLQSYNHGISEDAGNYGNKRLVKVEPVEVVKTEWRTCG